MKPQIGPTGLCLWKLPDSDLDIMWAGPGVGLTLGRHTIPYGMMTSIRTYGCEGPFATRKAAQAAVDLFVAKAKAQGAK